MEPPEVHQDGGFDCEFVEKPPKPFQSECPVCLLVLKEPYQTICCGKSYCRVCIERLKADKNVCPCCKKDIEDYPNVGLRQSLYDFKVYCINRSQGCQWTGELGQLDEHLNSDPSQQKRLEGCQFVQIECLHCDESFQRSIIDVHQNQQCQFRPFSCEYCKEFESDYEDVTKHWHVCGCYPMQCLNSCGKILQRNTVEDHIANDCPLTVISCDFQRAGCDVCLPRIKMPAHLNESIVTHMSLSYKQVLRLEKENKELKQEVDRLTHDLKLQDLYLPYCPITIKMTGFEKYKKSNKEWFSVPFYSHFKGYKLCLCVIPNGLGDGEGTHVSIFIHLMGGEFDRLLKWPFQGGFTVQLLCKDEEHPPCTKSIQFNANAIAKGVCNRVKKDQREESGWGRHMFVSHDDLQEYLKNDCLIFRITCNF